MRRARAGSPTAPSSSTPVFATPQRRFFAARTPRPSDIGRIRAVQEAALHIRHIERAVAADGWRGDPRRLAAGLALALDVFVRRDLSGLRVLGRMIDVILEDPGLGARARCAGLHVLAVGEAWRMAIPPVSPPAAPRIPAGVAS